MCFVEVEFKKPAANPERSFCRIRPTISHTFEPSSYHHVAEVDAFMTLERTRIIDLHNTTKAQMVYYLLAVPRVLVLRGSVYSLESHTLARQSVGAASQYPLDARLTGITIA